ncbi:hypothetical protein CGLO_03871 [Colletotrichum gloeosporioides Cg-14]|uniref:Uncharacterized protein n=1 Tax=Colletotrichum gloeosporioides (strain Cg-14) TaxID=1237896 RepID=T0KTZ8_COLGC|nr:hypothetical protein CGLO_03871 [Colletotrichum gloeosporioides Cg-14]
MGGSEAVEGPGVLATDSAEGSESRPMIEPAVTGVYGVKALWLTGGKGGMPMGCGGGAAVVLGEVADETEEESYDLVEGLGDRGYGLCDDAAIAERCSNDQYSRDWFRGVSTGSPR